MRKCLRTRKCFWWVKRWGDMDGFYFCWYETNKIYFHNLDVCSLCLQVGEYQGAYKVRITYWRIDLNCSVSFSSRICVNLPWSLFFNVHRYPKDFWISMALTGFSIPQSQRLFLLLDMPFKFSLRYFSSVKWVKAFCVGNVCFITLVTVADWPCLLGKWIAGWIYWNWSWCCLLWFETCCRVHDLQLLNAGLRIALLDFLLHVIIYSWCLDTEYCFGWSETSAI